MNLDSNSKEEIYYEAMRYAQSQGFALSGTALLGMFHQVMEGDRFLSRGHTNWAERLALSRPDLEIDIADREKAPDVIVRREWSEGLAQAYSSLPRDVELAKDRAFVLVNAGDPVERAVKNFLWKEALDHHKVGAPYAARPCLSAR